MDERLMLFNEVEDVIRQYCPQSLRLWADRFQRWPCGVSAREIMGDLDTASDSWRKMGFMEGQSAVTKEFLKDFQKCDRMVFRLHREAGRFQAEALVECIYEEDSRGDWVRPERRVSHNGWWASFHNTEAKEATFVELFASHGGIGALRQILRVGDRLSFEAWNNNSQLLDTKGITHACLYARVGRQARGVWKDVVHSGRELGGRVPLLELRHRAGVASQAHTGGRDD